MKNYRSLVASAALATLVLFGCKKETADPILQNQPEEVSFKGPGNNNPVPITDTIYVAYFRGIESGYSGPTNNMGWPQGNARYVGEQVVIGVKDKAGNWVTGFTATGQWSGCYSKTSTATANGAYANLVGTNKLPTACTLTFALTNLALSGYYYDASLNVQTSTSKVYP
jgi:hypothetical protein